MATRLRVPVRRRNAVSALRPHSDSPYVLRDDDIDWISAHGADAKPV